MSKFGVPTDEQLAKINKLAKRPLTADEVFVFSGKSAGDMLIPNRYTRISKELLQVMVEDAQKGVSFMYNHNWNSWQGLQGVPYGKVFDGELKPSLVNDETIELHLSKFIVRDDEVVDGMSANSLIKKIESGVLSDTSISFSTDTMVCSICGMNYYGGECSHWRGRTYDMADGTKKQCTLTAMPPSIIIPYNNNALYEESIVWDGAYPGAMISQASDGDIIELPTGNFAVLGEKEELPDKTVFISKYSNGNMLTMVKKSDHKKVFKGAKNEDENDNLEGVEGSMNEKVLKALESLGIEYVEGMKEIDILEKVAEKWDATVETIKASVEPLKPTDEFLSKETVTEKLGAELSADEVLKLAKEGQEYHKSLSDDAIAMGVRAMGNDFPKETWENSFTSMGTNSIKDIMKTWELQAKNAIPNGRLTDPEAEQGQKLSIPDDAFKVGK
ncbi:hypothetical protein [Tissierella sp.]|uniref:hypothetical protein n=1 Tax=Tissierella sp. TaxID=41274 RepID=UPI00285A9D41|nr:hypothetical protein [Tissierella sp.]MDR7856090.1 hypothetical protein [Tissierella sp.]